MQRNRSVKRSLGFFGKQEQRSIESLHVASQALVRLLCYLSGWCLRSEVLLCVRRMLLCVTTTYWSKKQIFSWNKSGQSKACPLYDELAWYGREERWQVRGLLVLLQPWTWGCMIRTPYAMNVTSFLAWALLANEKLPPILTSEGSVLSYHRTVVFKSYSPWHGYVFVGLLTT
jgi:hypothetical protein